MMMLPTGIKELQSIEDVCYLRETLAVEKSEQVGLATLLVKPREVVRHEKNLIGVVTLLDFFPDVLNF